MIQTDRQWYTFLLVLVVGFGLLARHGYLDFKRRRPSTDEMGLEALGAVGGLLFGFAAVVGFVPFLFALASVGEPEHRRGALVIILGVPALMALGWSIRKYSMREIERRARLRRPQ